MEYFNATNATTAEDILDIVKWCIINENITAQWKDGAGFNKTDAQVNQAGLITGTIELVESGERILEIVLEKEIAKLVVVIEGTITGTPKVGETLTASANKDATNVSYQWQVADSIDSEYKDIDGATNQELVLSENQSGKFIKVKISGLESSTATSSATEKVLAAFKCVTGVQTNLHEKYVLGEEIDLTVAIVEPADATNKTIIWSLLEEGGIGVTSADVSEGKFIPTAIGQFQLELRIINGQTETKDFVYKPLITIVAVKPEARFGTPIAEDYSVVLENLLPNTNYKWVVGENPNWYSSSKSFTTGENETTQVLYHRDFTDGATLMITAWGGTASASETQELVIAQEDLYN